MRPWHWFSGLFLATAMVFGLILMHGKNTRKYHIIQKQEFRHTAKVLGLSHIILSTEAPYLRYPDPENRFEALSAVPGGFELFPGNPLLGSMIH